MMTKQDFIETLSPLQAHYAKFSSFDLVYRALGDYIAASKEDVSDAHSALCVAVANFSHLCDTDPDCVKGKIDNREKERKGKELLKQHMKQFERKQKG